MEQIWEFFLAKKAATSVQRCQRKNDFTRNEGVDFFSLRVTKFLTTGPGLFIAVASTCSAELLSDSGIASTGIEIFSSL